MARITYVKKARKAQGLCGHCQRPIEVGDPYRHFAPGYHARKQVRCMRSECAPRQSELTASTMSQVYAAQEAFEDAVGSVDNIDDLRDLFEDYRQEIEAYRDERQEGLNQWEYGNSHLEDRLYEVQAYLDDLQGHEVVDFDDEEPEDEDDWQDWDDARKDWVQEQISEASDLVQQGF